MLRSRRLRFPVPNTIPWIESPLSHKKRSDCANLQADTEWYVSGALDPNTGMRLVSMVSLRVPLSSIVRRLCCWSLIPMSSLVSPFPGSRYIYPTTGTGGPGHHTKYQGKLQAITQDWLVTMK